MQVSVAVVTGSTVPHPDLDETALIEALYHRAVAAESVAWDDESVDWQRFDAAVVRSTWNYENNQRGFVAWCHAVERVTRLANPARVIEWNTDKRYLAELDTAGVPTVPTQYSSPGTAWEPPDIGEYVVKPTVAGGARGAGRFTRGQDDRLAEQLARRIHDSGRTVMIQPYFRLIDEYGEKVLIFLGDTYSHAVLRGPILGPHGCYVDITRGWKTVDPVMPSEADIDLARRALAATPGGASQLTYARVDLVNDESFAPRVLEVELTEPCLFLHHAPGAVSQLADLIHVLAKQRSGRRGL